MSEKRLITTKDGSISIFVPALNEHYHSLNGAIAESEHVFIDAGLKVLEYEKIDVFEMGFGTGLNACLTFFEAQRMGKQIHYDALELFPLETSLLSEIGADLKSKGFCKEVVDKILFSEWGCAFEISGFFKLKKINHDLLTYNFDYKYDLIYFDAFSPSAQPELWSESVFDKIYKAMKPNGILVTYCAKGDVKRVLRDVGFKVERLNGPPGKWHMLRASF